MASTAIVTLTKMMESLPESTQIQAVEHLRQYLAEIQDEQEWDNLYATTQNQLVAAAKKAKKEIADGKSEAMNFDQL